MLATSKKKQAEQPISTQWYSKPQMNQLNCSLALCQTNQIQTDIYEVLDTATSNMAQTKSQLLTKQ